MPSGKLRDEIKRESLLNGLLEQAVLMEKNARLMKELFPNFVSAGHDIELRGAAKITRDWHAEMVKQSTNNE